MVLLKQQEVIIMLKIKNLTFALLAFMVIVEVLLSLLFNVLAVKHVLPMSLRYVFCALLFLAIVFCIIIGITMRGLRKGLAMNATMTVAGEESDPEDEENITADMGRGRYYRITLPACGMLIALIYVVRLTLGPLPFKWTCAIADFANFTIAFDNVYLAIAFFGLMLFATVFVSQMGVEKSLNTFIENMKEEQDARNIAAQANTDIIRASNAEGAAVQAVEKEPMDDATETETEEEDELKEAERLRNEQREGVDVLGAVLKRKHRSNRDEELERRSAELRKEKREGVDVLGAVMNIQHGTNRDEELERRSAELRKEKREGVDVLGAVITNNLDPDEKY